VGGTDGKKCYSITKNGVTGNTVLSQPRYEAAIVVIKNNKTLWLTGGWVDGHNNARTKSTEFVLLTGTTPGPDLPLEVSGHCLVSLNDTMAFLSGGKLSTKTGVTTEKPVYPKAPIPKSPYTEKPIYRKAHIPKSRP
jgi:hypothetical protein